MNIGKLPQDVASDSAATVWGHPHPLTLPLGRSPTVRCHMHHSLVPPNNLCTPLVATSGNVVRLSAHHSNVSFSGVNCGSRQFPCVESEDVHVGGVEVVVPAENPPIVPPIGSPILSAEEGWGRHKSAERLPVAEEQIPAEEPSTFSAEGDTDRLHPGAQPMRVLCINNAPNDS